MNLRQFRRKLNKIMPDVCYYLDDGSYTKVPILRNLLTEMRDVYANSVTISTNDIRHTSKHNTVWSNYEADHLMRRDAMRYIENNLEYVTLIML